MLDQTHKQLQQYNRMKDKENAQQNTMITSYNPNNPGGMNPQQYAIKKKRIGALKEIFREYAKQHFPEGSTFQGI